MTEELVTAIARRSDDVLLSIPEIVDYSEGFRASFSGAGASKVYEEVLIAEYYEYLDDNKVASDSISADTLRHHRLEILDENNQELRTYSVLRSLLFDTALDGDTSTIYHLCEGRWYQVDHDYLRALTDFLDARYETLDLAACTKRTEGEYNEAVSNDDEMLICLDKTDISPSRQTQVEPCDIYTIREGRVRLIHVKISTDSSTLSHLFNQGSNSVELLKSEVASRDELARLVKSRAGSGAVEQLCAPIHTTNYEVTYAIITTKLAEKRSFNLPLFSRISLRRNIKSLELMGATARFGFIDDSYARATGRKKRRKKRAASEPPAD